MDEVSNGAFSKRSLPQEASFHVPVDNTELPEMENVFLETMNSVQTQIASVTSEQIPDVQLICELDTIDPDVLEYDVQTINSNGMNNTLSTPMTDGAIESLKGLEGMIKDLTVRANKTDDSLNSVLGEMVTVRISVKKVEQSFDALETSLKTVDTKAKQMDTRLIGVVENLNKVLQDYEDQFEVHDNRLLEIKDDAGKALAETNTNSIMIKEVCKIVSTQKEVLRKLTAPNGPNLNTISLDRPSALRVSTIERNSVHARTSVTPSPMEDSIVSASDSRNDHSSMFQDLGSLSSIVRQAHSQIVVMDDLDVNCDNDVGLRQPDNNPGFQPVQVGREDRVQRRDLQHHQDKNSDNGVRTSIRSSRERGSLSSSPPRSRKRDNSMKREVAENKLRRKIAELKKIIANNLLNAKTSEAEIKDAVVRQVPVLNELIESCDNAMDKYSEFSLIDEELMELLSVTIDEAGTWKHQAESLYKSAEIFDSNSGLDSKLVRGERAFLTLRQFVDNEAEAHSSNTPDIVQEETSKVEQSAAAVACPLLDDEEPDPEEHRQDERPTVLDAQMGQPQPARSTTTKPAGWYSSMLTFPCPIDNHNHELATCTEFFSSTPKQRRDIGRKKICFVCMGPMDKCVKKKNGNKLARMCVNVKKAGPLSCRACADYCRACGISSPPFCVIMCQDPSHPKPTIEEVGRVLNDYWPSFNPDTVTPSMVLSGGSLHNTVSMIPPCVKSSARLHVDPFEVIFDTQTGNSIRVGMNEGQKSNFPTPSEAQANPSIFVMQWLRIGSTDCLCFFDSGANIHMISGELAEKEGVKMVSQESTVLKILGKGEVATDYGTYRLNMSTTDQTGYQSFICHGLSEIAGPFDKHSLDKVNSELRATMEYSTLNAATLPDYVGGSKVHLLLGIHAQVLPVHLFTLPSGISVYRSPFTDIFGSNICYGGTHESFKKSATPLGACHAVHFISAELRDPAPPDDGDALIVEYHAKDPCPPCSPPLSRVDGQCFQIGAPPKGQNFFVDMATLLLSTVIWMCRIWKHELLATFEIFFSYLMCLYMVNLSKLFFSTHSGNIATTALGATGCPKELTEKTRQQTLSKRQLLVTLEFVILVLTRKHTDMLIAGLMDPLKYMYQVSAAIDNDHVKVWLHDAGPPSMVIFQEWRSECFIKYPVKPTLTAPPSWSSVVRGWRDVAILFSEDDIYLNSKQYFQALKTSDIDTCE